MIFQYPKLGPGAFRDRLRFRGDRFESPCIGGSARRPQDQADLGDPDGRDLGPNACYRTKVGCLRICHRGPTMLVYPEGTWYHGMTADRIPQFVEQHLVQGEPVADWVFARNPLREEEP